MTELPPPQQRNLPPPDPRFRVIDVVEHRRSRRRGRGWLLLLAPLLLAPIGGMLTMGDSFPTTAGVTSTDDQLRVVTIGCPNERLREVSLYRLSADGGSLPATLIWHATGDIALPDTFTLGVAPDGMAETVALGTAPEPTDTLQLEVDTDLVDTASLSFVVGEVPTKGVLGENGLYPSADLLRADEPARSTVCDPYGARTKTRLLMGYLGVTGALSIAGLVLLITTRQPRRTT